MEYNLWPEHFMNIEFGYNDAGQLRSFFEQKCSPSVTSEGPQVAIAVPDQTRCRWQHINNIVIPLCMSYVVKSDEERSILTPTLQVSWLAKDAENVTFDLLMIGDKARGRSCEREDRNRSLTLTGGWTTYNLTDYITWPDQPGVYTCTFKLFFEKLESKMVIMILEIL